MCVSTKIIYLSIKDYGHWPTHTASQNQFLFKILYIKYHEKGVNSDESLYPYEKVQVIR